jgi:hypothetical protein
MSRGAPRFPLKPPLPVGKGREDAEDWQAQLAVTEVLDRLGQTIIQPGGAIGSQDARAELLLLSGVHSGFDITATQWRLSGAPGATVEGKVRITSGVVQFDNINFAAMTDGDNGNPLVHVKADATALFTNCRFLNLSRDNGVFVLVDSGGKATFTNSFFEPATTNAANVVSNAGALANVYIVGGSNKTGKLHNNVTIIAETT